jgi:hypothetical protein
MNKSLFLIGLLIGVSPFLSGSPAHAQVTSESYNCKLTSEGGVTYLLPDLKFNSPVQLTVVGGISNEVNSVEKANLTCKVPTEQPELVPDAKLLTVCDDGASSEMGNWSHGFSVEVYFYEAKVFAQVSRKGILGSRPVADVPCQSSNQ